MDTIYIMIEVNLWLDYGDHWLASLYVTTANMIMDFWTFQDLIWSDLGSFEIRLDREILLDD